MGHYRSNLRDLQFNLFELFGAGDRLGTGDYADLDAATARDMLAELDRLATGPLAESFADADHHPPVFDPATRTVTMPDSFKRSFAAYVDAGWTRFGVLAALHGIPVPRTVMWAAAELVLGANPAAFMYAAAGTFAALLYKLGTEPQRRLAQLILDRNWGTTMVLTEPDAGSDVGAARTKAVAQPDGSWHLEGVKRFTTSGEWDIPENIVHYVLARPEGPGVESRPGTKGLSLFLVPKYRVDTDTGELGERNGVYASNLEHKMGLRASTTCEMTFGDGRPAVGWLLGDVHDGIAQMFQIIEYARMMVGTKAIATLSSGYLTAAEFARTRIQGADLTQLANRSAPRVPIIAHPDVRRMLMLQKSYAEGLRALVFYTAEQQDLAADGCQSAKARNELLLPLVKGVGSERSYAMLSLSLQTLGGSGYLQDYPIEQYLRDAKIDTLYEGTTAIQAQDLFFRKIVRDNGDALRALLGAVGGTSAAGEEDGRFKDECGQLGSATQAVQGIVAAMVSQLAASRQDPTAIYRVGQNTTRLLMALGDLLVGWLLIRQAFLAQAKLNAGATLADIPFYEGKVAAARFFAATVLPQLSAERQIAEAVDNSLMDLDPAAF